MYLEVRGKHQLLRNVCILIDLVAYLYFGRFSVVFDSVSFPLKPLNNIYKTSDCLHL